MANTLRTRIDIGAHFLSEQRVRRTNKVEFVTPSKRVNNKQQWRLYSRDLREKKLRCLFGDNTRGGFDDQFGRWSRTALVRALKKTINKHKNAL